MNIPCLRVLQLSDSFVKDCIATVVSVKRCTIHLSVFRFRTWLNSGVSDTHLWQFSVTLDWKVATMGKSTCGTCMLVSAIILGPIVMVLLAISFATDHWMEFDVDTEDLSVAVRNTRVTNVLMARYTHSRNRGIFRECYPGNDTQCKWTIFTT